MSANPSVAAAAGPDVDPIGAVTATSSDFSLNRHVSTLEASEKAVGEFVDFVEAIKTSPESQARVDDLTAVLKAHAAKVDELTAMIHSVSTTRKDSAATTIPDLRATKTDLQAVFARLDRVQSLLNNYELALKLADARATQIEDLAPPTTITGKLSSFFSSLSSATPAPAPTAASLPPWQSADIVPATADYFDIPATSGQV